MGGMFVGEAEGEAEFRVAVEGGYLIQGKQSVIVKGSLGDAKIDRVERVECKLVSR